MKEIAITDDKYEALLTNMRESDRKSNIGGIYFSRAAMSTSDVCDIPIVNVAYFKKNSASKDIFWPKCIKV